MSSYVVHELGRTVAVRWRRDLAPTQHWTTKVNYYRAVEELLAGGADAGRLSWSDVVAAVQPQGSRTTFFAVAGPHAKKPLAGAYRAGSRRELARCADRAGAPEMLVDETKVWSYWPHRDGWMDELFRAGEATAAVECLLRVLLDWAVREPALAAALDHAPPVCAVEDLVVLRGGYTPADAAARLLREAIRLRLVDGHGTEGVLHQLRHELRPDPDPTPGNRPLARALDQLMRNSRTPSDQRRQAVAMLRDALTVLESEPDALTVLESEPGALTVLESEPGALTVLESEPE
ncbi:hypothetical protein [Actinoplanes sp. URMC 104]|uniref:hypothetical protein n=1 Tax=Actinoplanes sp. URMC 104 TaxID=3423409 RepID=UPI003F1AE018